jgi:hypothetical protein
VNPAIVEARRQQQRRGISSRRASVSSTGDLGVADTEKKSLFGV